MDGDPIAIAWPRRTLSLLTYLATCRGLVARDAAAAALWPDDEEEDARGNLRRNLNLLRGVLPAQAAGWIAADAGSIGFDRRHTDVVAFELLAADPNRRSEAVAVYGGEFATPLYDSWVLVERERLRGLFHTILLELVGAHFSARRFDAALQYAQRIMADEPFREDVLRRIVATRYAMGDRPGALAEFERFARALKLEMDVDPMPETYGLHALILRGDPLPMAPDAARTGPSASGGSAPAAVLLPFGGREAALDPLRSAWSAAAAGDGRLVFIAGAAGIGKTRLVAELLDRSVGPSGRVLRAAVASPEARPFEVVLAALAQAAPLFASIEIEPVWLRVLAPLVPEIGARAGEAALDALPPEREILRTFEAITRLFIALGRARPLVVVFEDLHWAGPATLAAIRHVATRIRGHRVLVLATYRDDEGPAAETLRRDLCASGHAQAVGLAPMPQPEALAILAQLADPPTPAEAGLLVARSDGNPLFLTELLREFPRSLHSVARGIADVVNARLDRSSASAQTLAQVAATCGSTFDLDLLRAVLGWTDGKLIDGIAELLERQFVRATAAYERGSYAFTHALVRDAVGERAASGDRQRIHHIVARALEARSSDTNYAAEIAAHWQAANETERAARAYATAAQASLRTHARDEAASLATYGERLTADPRLRFDLVRIRIEANLRHSPAPTLRDDARLLAALAAELDETARYDAAFLAYRIEEVAGDVNSRRRCIESLRGFCSAPDAAQRAAELAKAEAANAMYRGDIAAALVAAADARTRYHDLGAGTDEARVDILIARIHARTGNAAAADALLAPLQTRVATFADGQLTMDYWSARSSAAHARYDARAMLDAAQHCHAAARTSGDRLMEGHAAWTSGAAHSVAGRLTHAFRETERATAIYASLGAHSYVRDISNNRASFLLQAGRIAEAMELLRSNLEHAHDHGLLESEYFAASNLGVALLAAGAAHEACGMQRTALELAGRIGSDAFAALAIGDLGAAEAAAGQVETGVARLRRAAAMHAALYRPGTQAHDLARAARWDPVPQTAASAAREALAIVGANADGIKHAPEILWCCALAFERGGDLRAAAYARTSGRAILERRAAAIEDAEDRRCYCELPHHAALLETPGAPSASLRRTR